LCLLKEPDYRPSAMRLLEHEFMFENNNKDSLMELINDAIQLKEGSKEFTESTLTF